MIVDSPLIQDLALGTERRIIQQGDSQVQVPSMIMPIVLSLQATHQNPAAGTPQQNSFVISLFQNRNNQAAASTTICTLADGLWEIEYLMSAQFDYTGGFGSADEITVQLNDTLTPVTTLVMSQFAMPGAWQVFQRARYLFRNTVLLQLNVPLTGVAENLNARIMINGIRIL